MEVTQTPQFKFRCPIFAELTVNELIFCLVPAPNFAGSEHYICYACGEQWEAGTKPSCMECSVAWRYIDGRR